VADRYYRLRRTKRRATFGTYVRRAFSRILDANRLAGRIGQPVFVFYFFTSFKKKKPSPERTQNDLRHSNMFHRNRRRRDRIIARRKIRRGGVRWFRSK